MGRTVEQTLSELFGLQRFEENPELDATIQKTLQRYPSLRSDGMVRKNETKSTGQEEHHMPETKLTHDQQIEEARRKAQPPFQPTDYTGLKVDNKIADQIAQQSAAELLSFERVGDKTRIQAKLPEKGCDPETGEEFNIRVNMNYFTRGIVRAVMDEDGSLNPEKAESLDNLRSELLSAIYMEDRETAQSLGAKLIDQLGIPREDREDFERFFRANTTDPNHVLLNGQTSPITFLSGEVKTMAAYQYVQEGNPLPENLAKDVDPTKWNELQEDTKADYENLCASYRAIAEMDPKEEKRVLQPSDCIAFRFTTTRFAEELNSWRERNGKEKIDLQGQDYAFNQTEEGYPAQKETEEAKRFFDEHHLMTLPVKLDGKDAVLSLENTAPPASKLLERPAVERTGVGLFENEDAVKQFHYSVNLGPTGCVDEIKAHKLLGEKMAEEKRTLNVRHPDVWERQAAIAREKAKTGTDEEVVDSFARHLAVQAVVEVDKDHRPPYDKRTIDQSVEMLKQGKSFKLMMQTYGVKGMREALAAPDPQAASSTIYAPQREQRYALTDPMKRQLRQLGASMQVEGRSEEWKKLHDALSDPNMNDTSKIFDAVEAYTKGRKSVRKTREGRESFDLAMTALAIAADKADPAAKQRAQNLVDRINDVRGAKDSKHKNHVSLDAYVPREPDEQTRQQETEREAQEAKRDAERLQKDAQEPGRAEKNQKFLGWLGKQKNMTQKDRANAEQYMADHPGVREEARRIAERRGLDVDIPGRRQPEKQELEQPAPQLNGPGAGAIKS